MSSFFFLSSFLKGCFLHSFTFTDMGQIFFTRTINLWNWILYHPDNIDINARHTSREIQSGRERRDAGCRFCNKQIVVAVKKEVKWQGQARADNYYPPTIIYSLLVEWQRAKQPPHNLIKERKIWIWCLCRLGRQAYISSVLQWHIQLRSILSFDSVGRNN